MDRVGDRFHRFVYCRPGRSCVVYALGQSAGGCPICHLSDHPKHRPVCFAGAWNTMTSMESETILPDLQSCVLCEDVRCEFNGMQTLVGVINVVPAPTLPINYLRLCIWTRWCSGSGKFRQKSRIVGVDEQQVIAQAEVQFELKEMEGHATNVHYFGGVQFQQYGLHHVEIYLENELRMRFPLPVIQVTRPTG